ncbi:MAG: PIN domain-containing protein [Nanoarchaeota archaeon]|nr:PIN domain-containing protein [Nanoarchaeota archaeon]MBU1051284.1 PIN domain-containing protein [Nanoarchaeota archaeon]MBU1989098.1 PIN domain-containing protein [Nanoarchaeota archaeon]
MSDMYFFDTYALIEVIRGNPNYEKYVGAKVITSVFNLAELNYNLKKEKSKEFSDWITKKYWDFVVDVGFDDLVEAMDLKTKHRNLSIPDAIGYVVAKKKKVKFLTGDEDFRDFDGVEFVKK